MRYIKSKLGIFLFLLCLGAVMAAIWYGLFGFSKNQKVMDGTLVECIKVEKMVNL